MILLTGISVKDMDIGHTILGYPEPRACPVPVDVNDKLSLFSIAEMHINSLILSLVIISVTTLTEAAA